MRINELLKEDEVRHTSVEPMMTKAGFKHLGSGAEADVWTKDDGSVTKIVLSGNSLNNKRPESLPLFIDYIAKNSNNPHLPKIFPVKGQTLSKLELGGNTYYQVSIEKLQELSPEAKKLLMSMTVGMDFRKRVSMGPAWFEKLRLKFKGTTQKLPPELVKQLPSFIQTARELYVFASKKKAGWDLASTNVMQRQDGTLVITDPWL